MNIYPLPEEGDGINPCKVLKTDDTKIFDDIFRRTYPKLFFYARSITGDDNDAEDVVAEVFEEMWKRRGEMEWGDRIEGFLYRAVFTRAVNLLKKRNHSEAQLSLLMEINDRRLAFLESDHGNPQNDLEQDDLQEAIQQALDELPRKCREVFVMSYVSGFHHQEIADTLGISVRTVEAHIYSALKFLRKRLEKMRTLIKLLL